MTQEQKDLLLKDLCARLPYGVRIQVKYYDDTWKLLTIYTNGTTYAVRDVGYPIETYFEDCKPYLFPLPSMTEEQAKEMQEIVGSPKVACIMRKTEGLELWLDSVDTDPTIWLDTIFEVQDWLNKNHFDYHGLIPLGLAIDATGLNIY